MVPAPDATPPYAQNCVSLITNELQAYIAILPPPPSEYRVEFGISVPPFADTVPMPRTVSAMMRTLPPDPNGAIQEPVFSSPGKLGPSAAIFPSITAVWA